MGSSQWPNNNIFKWSSKPRTSHFLWGRHSSLTLFPPSQSYGKGGGFLGYQHSDQRIERWKDKRWWQDKAPREDIENFIVDLSKKRFSKSEDPDKIIWGYSTSGNFNPKEALGLLTETLHIVPEDKWIKLWKGGWWPKISVFCWLVIKHRILTWDNLQVRGF